MSCPEGAIVIDYSCGTFQTDNGECTRGQPCPASGTCCESNPVPGIIISLCTLACCCLCIAAGAFFIYKMFCASQTSVAARPQQAGTQVVVVQQGAIAGQPQMVDQYGNPITQVSPVNPMHQQQMGMAGGYPAQGAPQGYPQQQMQPQPEYPVHNPAQGYAQAQAPQQSPMEQQYPQQQQQGYPQQQPQQYPPQAPQGGPQMAFQPQKTV